MSNKEYDYREKYKSKEKAERYDTRFFSSKKGQIFTRRESKQLKAAFKSFEDKGYILDMPCGTGRITAQLLDEGFSVVGGDISREMLDVAKNKLEDHPNMKKLEIMDGSNIPYEDNTFDGAVCIRFMCNLPLDLQKTILKELVRVSKETLVIGFSRDSFHYRLRNKLKRLIIGSANDYPVTDKTLDQWARDMDIQIKSKTLTIPLLSEQLIVQFEKRVAE
jgi:ubiquinone/menaquinone biosynthesis C-methylase UbiE